MKTTIKDIAKEAQVSVTTVSFVLNGKLDNISAETIAKVKNAVKKFNYTPNPIAVGLVTKKTKTIGLIIPDIQNMFFSEIAKNIEGELIKEGYNLILCNTDDKFERDIQTINLLSNRNVDGLIISPSTESMLKENREKVFNLLSKSSVPFVIIDRDLKEKNYSKVVNDHIYGGYIATFHLIQNGHRKIGCITGPLEVSSAEDRLKGYKKALEEYNINIDESIICEGDYHFEAGYEHTKELLKKKVTAIFVNNDLMAYGAYKACKELKYKIPDDISIVGFDDLYFSSLLDVPLTSVKQDVNELSKVISTLILEKVNCENVENKSITIKPTISLRSSVANIREGEGSNND